MDIETQAVRRFLGGPPRTDDGLTHHVFLWSMTRAARGFPGDLAFHRQGNVLTDENVLRCLMRFSPQTIHDLARLCDLLEFTASDEYRLHIAKLNGWLH